MVDIVFAFQRQCGIAIALVCLAIFILRIISAKKDIDASRIGQVVMVGLGGYAVPQCLLLIYCSFDIKRLEQVPEFPVYITLTAVCGLLIAYTTIKTEFDKLK